MLVVFREDNISLFISTFPPHNKLGPFLILDTLDSDTDPRIGVAFYWDREILLNNVDLDASSKS